MDDELFYKEFDGLDMLKNDMRGPAFHSNEITDARQHILEAYSILRCCEDRKDLINQADTKEIIKEVNAAIDQLNKLLAKYAGDEQQYEDWIGQMNELKELLEK